MLGKASVLSVLSLATLASCTTQEAEKAAAPAPVVPNPTATVDTASGVVKKTIVISKTYSYGADADDTATIYGNMIVSDGVVESITIDDPKGAVKVFADGISTKVVGKTLSGLTVDTVSGASLTTAAFNDFLKTVN